MAQKVTKAAAAKGTATEGTADKGATEGTATKGTTEGAVTEGAVTEGTTEGAVTEGAQELSVFDQAVTFCMKGSEDATKAEALWRALGCDALPAKLAVAAIDCALDQGETAAKRILELSQAPHLGADATPELVDEIVTNFLAWRLRRYAHTANAANMMHAWSTSVLRLHAFLQTL